MNSYFIARSYSRLLRGDQAAHIHLFAAESFAFLLRKTKDLSELVDEILINVLENPQLCPGIGRLFAETVKGVQKQFHSCTENVLTTLLSKLEPDCLFKSAVGTDAYGKMVSLTLIVLLFLVK